MIGEQLFPAIAKHRADLAGRITGMMLELDNSDLMDILDSEPRLSSAMAAALAILTAVQPEEMDGAPE
eukprot:6324709-Lingulodinium_polyedra.AAC.1